MTNFINFNDNHVHVQPQKRNFNIINFTLFGIFSKSYRRKPQRVIQVTYGSSHRQVNGDVQR